MSRTRSPITSRSNWAKESSTLSASRPMLDVVLKDWVMQRKLLEPASFSRVYAAILPDIRPVAAVLTEFEAVEVRGNPILEGKDQLMAGAVEGTHTLIPDAPAIRKVALKVRVTNDRRSTTNGSRRSSSTRPTAPSRSARESVRSPFQWLRSSSVLWLSTPRGASTVHNTCSPNFSPRPSVPTKR